MHQLGKREHRMEAAVNSGHPHAPICGGMHACSTGKAAWCMDDKTMLAWPHGAKVVLRECVDTAIFLFISLSRATRLSPFLHPLMHITTGIHQKTGKCALIRCAFSSPTADLRGVRPSVRTFSYATPPVRQAFLHSTNERSLSLLPDPALLAE